MSEPGAISRKRIQKIRDMIAAAERDGETAATMLLHLTLGDASELKRDRSVGVHEISFRDGEMRVLGVKVTEGGISVSKLDRVPA